MVLVSVVFPRVRPREDNNGISKFLKDLQTSRTTVPDSSSLLQKHLDDRFLAGVQPVPCHSHNDYWRNTPLFEALAAGCNSVEADISIDSRDPNELLVGHKARDLKTTHSLRSMYLNHIEAILDHSSTNAPVPSDNPSEAFIFPSNPNTTLVLLLDFKTSSESIWPVLQDHLAPFRQKRYLQHWDSTTGQLVHGPLTIVATGSVDPQTVLSATSNPAHDIFLDAPLLALSPAPDNATSPYNTSNSYYASSKLQSALGGSWFLPSILTRSTSRVFTEKQVALLKAQVKAAEELGLKTRYWGVPAWPVGVRSALWRELVEVVGVGQLNVDDVWGATKWDWKWCSAGWVGMC